MLTFSAYEGDNFRSLLQLADGNSAVARDKRSDGGGIVKDELLGKLIEFMESSEFDPVHAKTWIETKSRKRPPIVQENFAKGINNFRNSSYVMVANTQIGKTLSFLFLMFKAGLKEGMPSILLTKNNKGEPARFEASIGKFNDIVKASWRKVIKKARRKTPGQSVSMPVRDVSVVKGQGLARVAPPAVQHSLVDCDNICFWLSPWSIGYSWVL